MSLIGSTSAVVVSSGLLVLVGLNTDLWWIRGIMFVRGIVIAFNMVGLQTTGFSQVSRERMGRAASLWATQRQCASAFGVAVIGTILISQTKALAPKAAVAGIALADRGSLLAFHWAFAGAAVFGVIGLLLALTIHDRDVLPPKPSLAPKEVEPLGVRHTEEAMLTSQHRT